MTPRPEACSCYLGNGTSCGGHGADPESECAAEVTTLQRGVEVKHRYYPAEVYSEVDLTTFGHSLGSGGMQSAYILCAAHGRHQDKALQVAYGIQIAHDKEEGRKGDKTERCTGLEGAHGTGNTMTSRHTYGHARRVLTCKTEGRGVRRQGEDWVV